jgi:hypothetical protein
LIENLQADLKKAKESNKSKKSEIENLQNTKKQVADELSRAQTQIIELINENENLKDNQRDFYRILQTKIDEISQELKHERERRLHTESQLRVHFITPSLSDRNMKKSSSSLKCN